MESTSRQGGTTPSDNMGYMKRLVEVTDEAVQVIHEKTSTYGDSWKRRGGRGVWYTVVRPWDRLENIVEGFNGDVFAAIADDPNGADGSALACIRDIANYMMLIMAEAKEKYVLPPPE